MKKLLYGLILLILSYSISATDIVLNSDNDADMQLAFDKLLPIFTKKQKYWTNGEPITVYIKPINSIEHMIFITEWLGISKYRYKKMLKKQIYSGKSNSVKEVMSDEEMVQAVLDTPYSIGYLLRGKLIYSYQDETSETKLMIIFYE